MLTAVAATTATAVSIATDMTGGIVARFRTMPIARVSVLAGHVGGAVIQTVLGMVAVTALALLTGFRPTTSATDWLAAAAILILFAFALTWLSVALGLAAKSVESASNAPTPLIILAFLGSGFVLTQSMPTAIRWFAEYQPFTPVINTVRGLLIGAPIGHNGSSRSPGACDHCRQLPVGQEAVQPRSGTELKYLARTSSTRTNRR